MKKNRFMSKYFLLGFLFAILTSTSAFAQQQLVTGKVFLAGTQSPLSGVNVQIKGGSQPTSLTDGNGFFKLEVSLFPVDLVFSKENYTPQTLTVKKASDITINMIAAEATANDYGKDIGIVVSLNPESRDGILMFTSTDKRFKYWFDNRVYFDGAAYFGDNTYQGDENAIGNGVNIRRMRFALKAILWGNWGGEIDFDFGNNEVDIKDAFIRYLGDKWILKAGHFKEPFSMETTTTSRYLTFIERPYAAEQSPSRHLGISYRRYSNHLFFEGGLFSSTIANTLIRDQNKSSGTNAGWSATSRLAWAPIKKEMQTLHFGVAGSYRTPKIPEIGDPVNSFRYGENAETEINRKKYIDTDWIEHAKYETLLGLEAAYAFKNYRISGEYIRTDVTRDANLVPIGEDKYALRGFFVAGSWILNNANYYYNMGEAEFSQIDFKNNKKGAFELAVRYSFMDANTYKDGEVTPFIQGGAAETYTLGLNYYVNYSVRLSLNYAYVNHDRWADGKGKYKTDELIPLPAGTAGIDYSMIQARVEIDF